MMPKIILTTMLALLTVCVNAAHAQTKITYLFPAPGFLPAFSPWHIAKHKGYYASEGLDITFQSAKGGADAAKQIGLGNADIGGAIGDTPIIVRSNGVTVRAVALLGGRGLTQIVVRSDAGVKSFADLQGKKIGVLSFQDTTYYNLLAVLSSAKLTKSDASIQAVGPAGVVQLMISGDLQAISSVPEWTAAIRGADVKVDVHQIEPVFPSMAQVILASDKVIEERPDMVRKVVRATLKALREVMINPTQSALDYVEAVPRHKGKEKQIEAIMRSYGELVYKTDDMANLGKIDEKRMLAVQKFYHDHGIIQNAVPIKEIYTNSFVGG